MLHQGRRAKEQAEERDQEGQGEEREEGAQKIEKHIGERMPPVTE